MLVRHVAIIPETAALGFPRTLAVTAAIQKQVTRDFAPIWNVSATVDAFERAADAPVDYWQVRIVDELPDPSQLGFHKTEHNQPYALVQFTDDWSIAASHEILEMLADPSGDQLVASGSVDPEQGRVRYLVEVCDPVQEVAYSVNDTVQVCDFYTPHFFDPVTAEGVRYSFSGAISRPKELRRGGYLSFLDARGHWWRYHWIRTARPTLVDLGPDSVGVVGALRSEGESLRGMMDRATRQWLQARKPARPKNSPKKRTRNG